MSPTSLRIALAAGLGLALLLPSSAAAQDRMAASPTATRERVAAPGPSAEGHVVRVYEIFDITGFLDGPLLPRPQEVPTDPHEARAVLDRLQELDDQRAEAVRLADELAGMLMAFLDPKLAASVSAVDAHGNGSVLVVVADDRGHAWVESVLEPLRADPPELVSIETLVARGPSGTAGQLGLDPTHTLLADDAHTDLLVRLRSLGLEVITSPRLTTFPAQRGVVTVLHELAYVKDWELREVQPGGRLVADPTIDVLHDGLRLEVVALPVGDGHLGLDVDLQLSAVEQPIPTMEITLGEGLDPVEVGLPVVNQVRLDAEVVLPSGGAVAFATIDPESRQDVVVVVSARRLLPEPGAQRR